MLHIEFQFWLVELESEGDSGFVYDEDSIIRRNSLQRTPPTLNHSILYTRAHKNKMNIFLQTAESIFLL
jgi:hypothetical protein